MLVQKTLEPKENTRGVYFLAKYFLAPPPIMKIIFKKMCVCAERTILFKPVNALDF